MATVGEKLWITGLSLATVLMGYVLVLYDRELSLWLIDQRPFWGDWSRWMDQSIFRGEAFGGQDVNLIPAILLGLFYFKNLFSPSESISQDSIIKLGQTTFLIVLFCFVLVHAGKWGWGRARPSTAMFDAALVSAWYSPGKFTLANIPYSGSFPSGHTATALVAVIASLVLGQGRIRWVGASLGLIWGYAMAVSRSVLAHHWASDGVLYLMICSIGVVVLQIHWRSKDETRAAYWAVASVVSVFTGFGLASLGIGLRSYPVDNSLAVFVIGLAVIGITGFAWRKYDRTS